MDIKKNILDRPRRLRKNRSLREMVRENHLNLDEFKYNQSMEQAFYFFKDIENVENAELKTSRSLIEEITSLEQIEEALLPRIEFNQLNFNILTEFLCDEEFILYDSKASTKILSMK